MKRYSRLLAALLLLITALIMVITISFAWITISTTPIAQGIQITISGSHTVLVAPDIAYEQDGKVYHYPGEFSDNVNFAECEGYDYLKQLGGLLPVSTSDGETWYVPTYYKIGDPEVRNGTAYAGQIKPATEFIADDMLMYANFGADQLDSSQTGHYVYFDFWVVAPVDGYKLRVSTGADGAGSFVVDLPEPQKNGSSFELTNINKQAAASMRLGFLINEDTVLDESIRYYAQSPFYNNEYARLQGVYSQKGYGALNSAATRFTIFESNGDSHPTAVKDHLGNNIQDGQYVVTAPLGTGGRPVSVDDRLTVQLKNGWIDAGEETYIQQMFRTYLAGKDVSRETEESLKDKFYTQWLQYQIYPYVTKGNFIANTGDLYTMAGVSGVADAEKLNELDQAGATSDVYLTELTGGVPQKIRLFIWLEGQDVDCINSAVAGSFAISLELAGSNAG